MPELLAADRITQRLRELPGWQQSGATITRTFEFSGFLPAIAFVNHVGDLAERANHHPDIDIRWNKVTLTLTTHSADGLTTLDFDLAAQIDRTQPAQE